jgi:hypothetical protein
MDPYLCNVSYCIEVRLELNTSIDVKYIKIYKIYLGYIGKNILCKYVDFVLKVLKVLRDVLKII